MAKREQVTVPFNPELRRFVERAAAEEDPFDAKAWGERPGWNGAAAVQ
jgi:hypothetical protein